MGFEECHGFAGALPSVWGVWGHFGAPIKTIESDHVAQMAERVLGKDEVSGSIPDMGSIGFRVAGRRGAGAPPSEASVSIVMGESSAR